ncbi:MAG: outer membrane protein assembly factor BamD [Rhizobiales bacterium]|nr:outer membrane protein assembly factor BamD [Hyphomicrobiales bacterium]
MVLITSAAPTGRLRLALLAISLVALPMVLGGCQNVKDKLALANFVAPTDPADKLYNEGLANLNAGRLKEASAKFDAIDKEHPYSEYSRKAEVMGAFTKYRMGKYDDAITTAQRYMELYPSTDDAAYAQYIIGLSYFRQIRDVTQDQKESRQTIEAMTKVVDNYPDSPYVEDAKTKIRFARDQLAGKEMQVGRYYLERRDYLAAIKRFRVVVENYSNTNQIEEALARLTEAYYAMGIASEAQTAAAVLGQNYPDSKWYKDSYALLQSGGLSPSENKSSWISKAFHTVIGG